MGARQPGNCNNHPVIDLIPSDRLRKANPCDHKLKYFQYMPKFHIDAKETDPAVSF
jgi:hypothetical protein